MHRLERVSLSAGLESIGKRAFFWCEFLHHIDIPESVTEIGPEAFYKCITLEHVTLSENIGTIRKKAFLGCGAMKQIHVDERNRHYRAIDGVLYNKAGTKLIRCPEGKKNVIFSERVTSIEKGAFEGCSGLLEICLPESVTSIGRGAFYQCSRLEKIVLPEGIGKDREGAVWLLPGFDKHNDSKPRCQNRKGGVFRL